MRKTFKKLTAAVTAVTTLAVGMTGMVASAASDSFSSRYIYGAPGSESYTDVAVVTASSGTYTAYCKTLDISGTSGKLTVSCSNYTMSKSVEFTQKDKKDYFKISGNLNSGSAKFPCSCYGNGNVYSTGTISC